MKLERDRMREAERHERELMRQEDKAMREFLKAEAELMKKKKTEEAKKRQSIANFFVGQNQPNESMKHS